MWQVERTVGERRGGGQDVQVLFFWWGPGEVQELNEIKQLSYQKSHKIWAIISYRHGRLQVLAVTNERTKGCGMGARQVTFVNKRREVYAHDEQNQCPLLRSHLARTPSQGFLISSHILKAPAFEYQHDIQFGETFHVLFIPNGVENVFSACAITF